MKGHTVPWAFLPTWMQALLAIALIAVVVNKTYNNPEVVHRWWPWLSAVASVLLAPTFMQWLGFGPQGIQAKTMAAELQSLATGMPWLKQVVSALQSISTKGMGLRTAGVIFTTGGAFGHQVAIRVYDQLRLMGYIQPQAVTGNEGNGQLEAKQEHDSQAVAPGDDGAQNARQADPQHAHDE